MLLRSKPSKSTLAQAAFLLCASVLWPGVAQADGDDYFVAENAEGDSPPALRYFGRVRDQDGNPLGGVIIYFEQKHPPAYVIAKTFPDGGYRSPDLGNYILALGSEIDFRQIQVRSLKDGYDTARPPTPESNEGRVQLDIVMTKKK